MKTVEIGQKVLVTPEHNPAWAGEGVVTEIREEDNVAILQMTTGKYSESTLLGGFEIEKLEPVVGMRIVSLKRSTQKTGLKVYGKVLGESGKEYNVAYFRRPNFRGWICSCESFFFTMFKKNRNCKHLRFVRGQVGRFAASVK